MPEAHVHPCILPEVRASECREGSRVVPTALVSRPGMPCGTAYRRGV
ncbi:MAG TPA: hypothetical protein PKC73_04215 [Dermatophilaceae bacterium]|nr:hypothetical protein [Actinomycetales bacterium]HMT32364.1 hypothetical protein [Dermatophilaceae bacterium]HMT88823.1 hypothetical protein [Dermatophilaceae bacterium]